MATSGPSPDGSSRSARVREPAEQRLFQRRLVQWAAGVVVLSGCLVALALAYVRTQALETGERLTEAFAQVIEEQTTRTFQTVDQAFELAEIELAQMQAAGTLNEDTARQFLRQKLKAMPFVRILWVTDINGRLRYDTEVGNIGANLSDTAYFKFLQSQPQTDFYVSGPVKSRIDSKWLVPMARPLRSANGAFAGTIAAAIDPHYFDKLWQSLDLGKGGSVTMFRRDGVLMMRSPFDEKTIGKNFQDRPFFKQLLPKAATSSFESVSSIDGISRVLAYRTLSAQPSLIVAVGQSHEVILRPWRNLAILAASIWTVAAAVIILLCVVLNRAWLRRLGTEARLRQSEEDLAITLQSIGDAVIATDAIGQITRMNPTAERLTGWPLEDAAGRPLTEVFRIIHAQTREPAIDPVQRVMEHGQVVGLANHTALLARDGHEYQISDSAAPIRDGAGTIVGMVLVFSDVTEAYRVRETLEKTSELLQRTGDLAKIGGWETDVRTGTRFWSPQIYSLLELDSGAEPDANDDRLSFYAPTVRPQFEAARRAVYDHGTPWSMDVPMVTAKGRSFWAHVQGFAELEAGKVVKIRGTLQDISQHKLAEAALRESEARFRSSFDSAGIGMAVCKLDGQWLQVNQRLCDIVGYHEHEMLEMTFHRLTHPDDLDQDNAHMEDLLKGTVSYFHMEKRYLHKQGHAVWINLTVSLVRDANGAPMHTVAHMENISERKQLEQDLRKSQDRLRATLDAVPDLLFEVDAGGTYHDVHSPHTDLLVAPVDQLLGKRVSDMMPPEAAREVMNALQDAEKTGRSGGRQIMLPLLQGNLWFELSVARKARSGSDDSRFVVLSRDITGRKQAEIALGEAALHTQTVLDNMVDGVITINALGLVEFFNKAATQIFGYDRDEVLGRNVSMLMPEAVGSEHDNHLQTSAQTGGTGVLRAQREVDGRRKDGSVFPMSIAVSRIERAGVFTLIGIVRDVTQNRRDIEEIRRLAFFDPLTGLPNRRLLMDRLKQAMVSSARSGQFGALMFLDLDHFKILNDSLGHDVGDLLLQQVAARLQACVREGDSVARLGGDEFVVLLENLSALAAEAATQAEVIANKVRETFSPAFNLRGHPCDSTPSIGIVMFSGDDHVMDDLLKKADVAMYQAKAAGRNAVRFFDPAMQAGVEAHDALEKEMRRALVVDEFELHYQIQVSGEGVTTGAEALVRWHHPGKGMLLPGHFIPLAEETGLILKLGQWVLETACAQLALWAQQPATAPWTISVNVSATQFAQADFVANVTRALQRTGANPARLKLELTESTLVKDIEDVITKMNAIRAFGVGFSLDDFGTGYSSLSYIKRLPLDQLKIDQSFVRDILTDPSDAVIARTIVVLGQSLGLNVIAEGVETAEQRDMLVQMGCRAFQGYLFGRPAPAASLK